MPAEDPQEGRLTSSRDERVASITAALVTLAVLLVSVAGADKPPPIGFLWLAPLFAGIAWLVRRAVPGYLERVRAAVPLSTSRLIGSGALIGAVLALGLALLGAALGRDGLRNLRDLVLWTVALALAGMLVAGSAAGISRVLARRP